MTLASNWDDNSLPSSSGATYNDIWGWAGGGREYAIMGSLGGTHFIDVTDPTNPQPVAFEAGGSSSSIWRDYKTYGNYLYAVSDQGLGSSLQIFDLSGLPTSVSKVYDSQAFFTTAHNIFIDEESGHLYVAGTTINPSGVIILDVASNPANPTLAANFTLGAYVHDVFVRNDTCYAFMGTQGWGVFDFSNLLNPQILNFILPNTYPEAGYAHSGWASDDFNTLYWCDETHDTGVHVGDISDPTSISFLPTFRSTLLGPTHTNSLPHNCFVKGNLLYVSYYHDGVQVWDISNPTAPVRAAYYDTDITNTNYSGMRGSWGVYPYLPSGTIIASDVRNGLFVLQETTLFPVTFGEFVAESQRDRVRLRWNTFSETNNEKFVIERSADGVEYASVTEVTGAGNSQDQIDYETFDDHPLEGRSYYRLKQVDKDGSFDYSEVRTLNRGVNLSLRDVFPSPATPGDLVQVRVNLEIAQNVRLRVTDMIGRLVHEQSGDLQAGMQRFELPISHWAAGTYYVLVQGRDAVAEQKFVIAR
ncbi:MAG: choice-of-anchor B family protein [Bacteroidota bacterium]